MSRKIRERTQAATQRAARSAPSVASPPRSGAFLCLFLTYRLTNGVTVTAYHAVKGQLLSKSALPKRARGSLRSKVETQLYLTNLRPCPPRAAILT